MGQTWSKFTSGHMEAGSNDPPAPEACSSPDPNSQASTEASSSVPLYQGGPFSVAAADVELSSLKDEDEKEFDQERGKETQTTPTPSTSQQLFPPKGPEKAKSSHGSRTFKQPRLHKAGARKFRAQEEPPFQFSPSQAPEEEEGLQVEEDEEETASQSMLPEPDDVDLKVDSTKEAELPPHSSQKMLFFELDRKRKAPAGLPSLAVECMGSSCMRLKAGAPLEKPRSPSHFHVYRTRDREIRKVEIDIQATESVLCHGGGARKDLGAGEALVGRRVRKVEYDNGKKAAEWLDLEQSKTSSAPVEKVKGPKPVRKSLRNAAAIRAKKMEEFVYTKRSVRGRRRKK